jgi:putative Mn2+ efflux pump MntP
MDLFLLLTLAFVLSMDSFSVAVAKGVSKFRILDGIKMAIAFSIAHFVMIIIGWLGGNTVNKFISGFDHWIAFVLLAIVGSRMIYDYFQPNDNVQNKLSLWTLLVLSVATSIDTFAIGISFAFLGGDICIAAGVIACVIFVLTLCGLFAGLYCGNFLGKKSEIVGGLVLIGIGVKTLVEHL